MLMRGCDDRTKGLFGLSGVLAGMTVLLGQAVAIRNRSRHDGVICTDPFCWQ
jgi:hypothetical protein